MAEGSLGRIAAEQSPGPWLQENRTVYALNERGTNRFTAHVDAGWQHGYLGSREDKRTSEGELAANARLMAAAPDLLEALQAASGYLLNAKIDLETGAPKKTAIQTIEGGLRVVRAAISKATGTDQEAASPLRGEEI